MHVQLVHVLILRTGTRQENNQQREHQHKDDDAALVDLGGHGRTFEKTSGARVWSWIKRILNASPHG
jgi:hypothetical protein